MALVTVFFRRLNISIATMKNIKVYVTVLIEIQLSLKLN